MTDKPLTPRERVRRLFIKLDKDDECDWSAIVQFKKLSDQLAAEIEEANRRAENWAKDAGRYAANADFWRKRAEAAERQLAEKDARIKELETRDKIWRNRVEKYPSTTTVFKAARKETP